MKKLIISPQAGFGNRLRALCSARIFGALLGRDVFHYWTKDHRRSNVDHVNYMKDITPSYLFDLNIPLFDGNKADVCFTEWTPGDYWYNEQSTAQSSIICGRTTRLLHVNEIVNCEDDSILIETSHALMLEGYSEFWSAMMTSVYNTCFRLNDRWSCMHNTLPVFDYGIAIRRGNYLFYYPDADVKAEVINDIIRTRHGSKIVFSDDSAYQAELRALASCPLGVGVADSGLEGLDNIICQFLILSKCKTILSTRGSSFAEQAALFGGTKYEAI